MSMLDGFMSDPDQHRNAHSLLGLSLPCKTMGANAQVATRCYLMLQTQGRLCDGHCLIVPSQLVVSLVQVCIHSYPHNPGSQAARIRSCRTFLAPTQPFATAAVMQVQISRHACGIGGGKSRVGCKELTV